MRCEYCGDPTGGRWVRFVGAVDVKVCPECRGRIEAKHGTTGVALELRSPCAGCAEGAPKVLDRKYGGLVGACRAGCEAFGVWRGWLDTLSPADSRPAVDPAGEGYSFIL